MKKDAYSLSSTSNTLFSNCIVNPRVCFGEESINLFDKTDFL